jgi:putative sterol carrier protein
MRHAPSEPLTVQWEFTDAPPWHLRVDNGSTAAAPGRADADLALRCAYDDWVDVIAGRADPRRLVATARLRPRGSPFALWRARRLFG